MDFGSLVVRTDTVASVGRSDRHPLRLPGLLLILTAVALVGFEAAFNLAAFSVKAKGSLKIWAACGTAGIGVFCLVYAQRCLVLQLAGGSKVVLRIASQSFTDELLDTLRRALKSRPGQPFHAVADLAAETFIETAPEEGASHHQGPLPHGPVGAPQHRPAYAPAGSYGPMAGAYPPHNGNGAWPPPQADLHAQARPSPGPGGLPNGHAPMHGPGNGAGMHQRPAPQQHLTPVHSAPVGGQRPPMPFNGPQASPAVVPAGLNGQPPTFASPALNGHPATAAGNRDLGHLIDFIGRSEIQHKETLLELLRVVEDHELGGRTSREDALSHWKSFSDYVVQYLTGVDGLPLLTAQVARSLTRLG